MHTHTTHTPMFYNVHRSHRLWLRVRTYPVVLRFRRTVWCVVLNCVALCVIWSWTEVCDARRGLIHGAAPWCIAVQCYDTLRFCARQRKISSNFVGGRGSEWLSEWLSERLSATSLCAHRRARTHCLQMPVRASPFCKGFRINRVTTPPSYVALSRPLAHTQTTLKHKTHMPYSSVLTKQNLV